MPATSAGDQLIPEHIHCLDMRKGCRGALTLEVDVMAFGTLKYYSVSSAHTS